MCYKNTPDLTQGECNEKEWTVEAATGLCKGKGSFWSDLGAESIMEIIIIISIISIVAMILLLAFDNIICL